MNTTDLFPWSHAPWSALLPFFIARAAMVGGLPAVIRGQRAPSAA